MTTLHDTLCPIIGLKSPKSLARLLGYSLSHIEELCDNIQTSYSRKEITKKNGAIRILSVPSRPLRKVQKAILRQLKSYTLHPAAYGAVQGKCHVDNAKQHSARPYVYCLDFSSFFPSISSNRIYNLFHRELGCSPPVAGILTKLTTYKYKLPIGTPTSAILANILCHPLDKRLYAISEEHGLSYTRFIDDLTFSGRAIPESFTEKVKSIIEAFGLPLNKEKEEYLTPENGKLVTGVNVNVKNVRVPRSYKRKVRAHKHNLNRDRDKLTKGEIQYEENRIASKEQYIKMVRTR